MEHRGLGVEAPMKIYLPNPVPGPLRFSFPEPTPEEREFQLTTLAHTNRVMRRETLRREWALRQVFMDCLTHYREVMSLERSDA